MKDNKPDEITANLLAVAEMYRDQMNSAGSSGTMAWLATDKAIRDYYKVYPCPHRLKYIKTVEPVTAGCETTVMYCPDCEKQLTNPNTEC